MYEMDNELYRNSLAEFIKYLNKWRELTGNYKREPLVKYENPTNVVTIYINVNKIHHHINMYKWTHKSKWIHKYRDLIMSINETEMSYIYSYIRACNNNIAKLITRKRGKR